MPGFDFQQFGRAFHDARHARGLTVRDVERLTSLSLGQISRIEQGEPVGLRSVLAVCRFLDCPVETFIPAEPVNSDTPYAPNGAAEQTQDVEDLEDCEAAASGK